MTKIRMSKIAFIICTRRRIKYLEKLINSFNKIVTHEHSVSLIIVENDNFPRSKFLLNKLNKKFKSYYLLERRIGIPYSRNSGLKFLKKKLKINYFAFIDDDCEISSRWIVKNYEFLKKTKADIVTGPQVSKTKNIMPNLLNVTNKHMTKINWAATNNVICQNKILNEKVFFDVSLSKIGGSDQLFFMKLNKKKYKILWNKNSVVYENINSYRKTFKYFFLRNIRYSSSSIYIFEKCYNYYFALFINTIKILKQLLEFLYNLISMPLNMRLKFLKLLQNLFKIFGLFLGFFNITIKNY